MNQNRLNSYFFAQKRFSDLETTLLINGIISANYQFNCDSSPSEKVDKVLPKMTEEQELPEMTKEEIGKFLNAQMEGTMNMMQQIVALVDSNLDKLDQKVDELSGKVTEIQKRKNENDKK